MAKWYDDLKSRRVKGAGSVTINLDDGAEPIVVDLRYPRGKDKAKVLDVVERGQRNRDQGKSLSVAERLKLDDDFAMAALRACLKFDINDDPPDDDVLEMLVTQTGGLEGRLIQRCIRLLGFYHLLNEIEAASPPGRDNPATAHDGGAGSGAND